MTYCVGVRLDDGLILASDSRTHAGVDNFATFCKMTVIEQPGDRVLVLLSSGGWLAGTRRVFRALPVLAWPGQQAQPGLPAPDQTGTALPKESTS